MSDFVDKEVERMNNEWEKVVDRIDTIISGKKMPKKKPIRGAEKIPGTDAGKVKIFDSGEGFLDRYTVVLLDEKFGKEYTCLGVSGNPDSPHGISQFSGCVLGRHLGNRIRLKDMPGNVQKHVRMRVRE